MDKSSLVRVLKPEELVVGKRYWLKDKRTGEIQPGLCKRHHGNYLFFKSRIWAYPGNTQAFSKWYIFELEIPLDLEEFTE